MSSLPICANHQQPFTLEMKQEGTYLNVVDLEWLRVTQRRSQCSILGAGRTHQEFKLVEGKLDPRFELILWSHWPAEVETVPNSEDRLKPKILAPVQVLDQTQPIGVLIAPCARSARSVLERTNGFVPLPEVWWGITLEVVAYILSALPGCNAWLSDLPPGKRRNFPFNAARASAISTRRPLGLFL